MCHLIIIQLLFNQDSVDFGTLTVTGYLQGRTPLSVNSLVHIPGFGDFQMSCIEVADDPYPVEHTKKKHLSNDKMEIEMKDCATVFQVADPEKQVSRHFIILITKYCIYKKKYFQVAR